VHIQIATLLSQLLVSARLLIYYSLFHFQGTATSTNPDGPEPPLVLFARELHKHRSLFAMTRQHLNGSVSFTFAVLILAVINNVLLCLDTGGTPIFGLLLVYGLLLVMFMKLLSGLGDIYYKCLGRLRGKNLERNEIQTTII
jgi:hypothetical protein